MSDSVRMSLDVAPPGIDLSEVQSYLVRRPGVAQMHDLHVWPMSTKETALTCHFGHAQRRSGDMFLMESVRELGHRFSIGHATIQIEPSEDTICPLAPTQFV